MITTLHILSDVADASLISKNTMNNTIQGLRIIKELNVQCKPRIGNNIKSCKWGIPTQDEVKICCDGSALGIPGVAGISIIYRNNKGEVLGIYSKSIGQATNFIAEITSIISGVQRAVTQGWRRVWVVSDSAAAIKAFIKDKIPWTLKTA
ncbi:hypothetical protein GIB67_027278 [Kingdonia uniflora]|uniref:RNase H type-1 domain-containing protein n=1 Tax=Kingdonia uniflora TaxID=39325 RepID=A0A7J7KYP6_9MAGN|nr:hypothetical protein GIB67_027278 [Kingdonia uniflora]